MERWAKKMNNANEARKHAVKQAQEELKMLEQKEEELRQKIKEEKSIVNTLDSTVKNKVIFEENFLSYFLSEERG